MSEFSTFKDFKHTFESKLSKSNGFNFIDLDTVKFAKDAFKLIDEV